MSRNATLDRWRAGEVAYGAWLHVPGSLSAELIAKQGFDWVAIDLQHGGIDYSEGFVMLQAISTSPATPFVRVPTNEPGIIGRVLDAGAMGVVVPMVNTAADAAAAVAACRYFPAGSRSFGPVRAGLYTGGDYFATANEQIVCIVMIETEEAYRNLDEILAVPGVDAVYVGPSDLSITLGQAPRMDAEGAFSAIRQAVPAAARARGIVAGIHGDASLAELNARAGYRMLTVTSDVGLLFASGADLARAKQAVADIESED